MYEILFNYDVSKHNGVTSGQVDPKLETDVIYNMDCLEALRALPDDSINCCVTSPPYYGLRDYGSDGQIGRETTPDEYISRLIAVFRELFRVLRPDGTLWLNIADSYCGGMSKGGYPDPKYPKGRPGHNFPVTAKVPGCKSKDLIGIPWLLAFALRSEGWYLRQDIIWNKPNAMPESVRDRCVKAHEYIFLFSKNKHYYFDNEAIKETCVDGILKRNRRSVWNIPTKPYKGEHFATYPVDLIIPCILAGCPSDGVVIDPFFGSGTTGLAAKQLNRRYIGIELNPEYCGLARERIGG